MFSLRTKCYTRIAISFDPLNGIEGETSSTPTCCCKECLFTFCLAWKVPKHYVMRTYLTTYVAYLNRSKFYIFTFLSCMNSSFDWQYFINRTDAPIALHSLTTVEGMIWGFPYRVVNYNAISMHSFKSTSCSVSSFLNKELNKCRLNIRKVFWPLGRHLCLGYYVCLVTCFHDLFITSSSNMCQQKWPYRYL